MSSGRRKNSPSSSSAHESGRPSKKRRDITLADALEAAKVFLSAVGILLARGQVQDDSDAALRGSKLFSGGPHKTRGPDF
ncbi:hypothetical protein PC9H_002341 [Pleurotus ostreatus]|uniref:Uncharacterized protein n=1 Tax=Pleurotus ostreatus TaxID=5322 RepID=A0A8H7DKD4_PLEOS|nr:uncharacterized protein PC9H_002341 [Pleurotus ostreatus]KAF7416081.1 hypothetical protein PC9H_002341 [Pleurotus ostreatus]